jgi:hypothetical protein
MRRKVDEEGLAFLETLAHSKPPQGEERWTMQLLPDRPVEVKVVTSISDETVRREFKSSASGLG